ncbi:MAG: stage V sporulation protein AB [Faecalimonas sp.]|nr:stage V sporulation protein AB [Tyzzerella sp.]MEE0884350.1 stage V sporulation protein AB [Faecalimonas sp.]
MLVKQILLAIIGLSSGILVAGGLFGFIVSLGVISDFADRTHSGNKIRLYERALALGGSLGNVIDIFEISIPVGRWLLAVFGIFAGIFVGGWAMALAETLNVFPIFMRRAKLVGCIPYIILSIAIGKGIGSLIYFWYGW